MEENEVDEQEIDSPTLLDYLKHGLLGYIIGLVIYCIYLLVASGLSVETRLPFANGHGMEIQVLTTVWGRDINDIVVWGFLFPIGITLSGLIQARFIPISYLIDREMLIFLIVGVLFMSLVTYSLLIGAPNSSTVFEAPRSMHP